MKRTWTALAVVLTLGSAACGTSRQSGICGDINPAPTETGDAAALEAQADAAWEQRGDQAQAEQAIALYEQILRIQPNRPDVRAKLAAAHYFVADSHLWFEQTIKGSEAAATAMLAHYQKGTDQAELALGQQYPAFRTKYCARQPFETALQQLDKDAVPAMYWYATNLGRYALMKSLVEVLNQKDRVKAMMETIKRLDPAYYYYAADRYFGVYYTKIPFPSGDLPQSRKYFEASIAGAPSYQPTKLLFGRENVAKAGDRELFKRLMDEIIAFDLDSAPDVRPENEAAKKKAEYFLGEIDFIVEE